MVSGQHGCCLAGPIRMEKNFFHTVQGKLLAALLPTVLIASLLLSASFGAVKFAELEGQIKEKGERLASQYATALAAMVWNFDTENLQRTVNMLASDADVLEVVILDAKGEELVQASGIAVGDGTLFHRTERIIRYSTGDKRFELGRIRLSFHDRRLWDIIVSEILYEMLLLVVLIAAILLAVVIVYRSIIHRPLERLLHAFYRTQDLEQLAPVEWDSRDEFGDLVEGYEQMRSRLQREGHALKESEARFRVLQEASSSGILICDGGRVLDANNSFLSMTGFSVSELGSRSVLDLVTKSWRTEVSALMDTGEGRTQDVEVLRKDGEVFPAEVRCRQMPLHGKDVTIFELRDISYRRAAEEKIHHLALYDSLTGLPNRRNLIERLESEIKRIGRDHHRIAVLIVNLNSFKTINETHGHSVGDSLLVAVGQRLRGLLRETDVVARVGGDEFAVIQLGVEKEVEAALLASKVRDAFQLPFHIGEKKIYTTVSIGITLCDDEDHSPQDVLKRSDIALDHSKQNKVAFSVHSDEMSQNLITQVELGHELKQALDEQRDLFLLYQPQIDLVSGKLSGVEALVRWQHPDRGLLLPGSFISIAEDQGLIGELGHYVLREACEQCMRWSWKDGHNIPVAVNVSVDQLSHPGFPDEVRRIVASTGISPELLELEITESIFIKDIDTILQTLVQVGEMGIRIAIDDFGTGFSSLQYLKMLPIHKLKIAREFIRDVLEDSGDAEIVRAILSLAESFNLVTIAEGVEQEAQRAFLMENECQLAQGFLYAKPVASDDILDMAAEWGLQSTLDVGGTVSEAGRNASF